MMIIDMWNESVNALQKVVDFSEGNEHMVDGINRQLLDVENSELSRSNSDDFAISFSRAVIQVLLIWFTNNS